MRSTIAISEIWNCCKLEFIELPVINNNLRAKMRVELMMSARRGHFYGQLRMVHLRFFPGAFHLIAMAMAMAMDVENQRFINSSRKWPSTWWRNLCACNWLPSSLDQNNNKKIKCSPIRRRLAEPKWDDLSALSINSNWHFTLDMSHDTRQSTLYAKSPQWRTQNTNTQLKGTEKGKLCDRYGR